MSKLQFLIVKSNQYLNELAQENDYTDWVSYCQGQELDDDIKQVCLGNAKDWAEELWNELEAAE
jgi:hypothetical protein